jgi:uncharacterized membrane protein
MHKITKIISKNRIILNRNNLKHYVRMSLITVLNATRSTLVWIVLFLSIICLVAESLPEVKAKIIVVPTLVLMIILSGLEIHNRWNAKRKMS